MNKWLIPLNIVLIVASILLYQEMKNESSEWVRNHDLDGTLKKKVTPLPANIHVLQPRFPVTATVAADLSYIGDNNVFHKDRNMVITPKNPPPPPPKLVNKPVVDGVMFLGEKKLVLLRGTRSGTSGAASVTLKEGDLWDKDWKLTEITEEKIVLENGPSREEIMVFDANRPRTGGGGQPSTPQSPQRSGSVTVGSAPSRTSPQPGQPTWVPPPTAPMSGPPAYQRNQPQRNAPADLFRSRSTGRGTK